MLLHVHDLVFIWHFTVFLSHFCGFVVFRACFILVWAVLVVFATPFAFLLSPSFVSVSVPTQQKEHNKRQRTPGWWSGSAIGSADEREAPPPNHLSKPPLGGKPIGKRHKGKASSAGDLPFARLGPSTVTAAQAPSPTAGEPEPTHPNCRDPNCRGPRSIGRAKMAQKICGSREP